MVMKPGREGMVGSSITTAHGARPSRGRLWIAAGTYRRLCLRVAAHPGVEVCGLLAGRDGRVERSLDVDNIAPDPARRFEMDPGAQLCAFNAIERAGQELLAIHHSHPHGPAYPSAIDLDLHHYPRVPMLIFATWPSGEVHGRLFMVRSGWIVEQVLDVS